MKKSLFSEAQRKAILAEHDQTSTTVEKVCENINQDVDKKRLSDLEKENAKLKKIYLNAQLEKEVLAEAVSILKKFAALNKKTG